jgi:hypothetical protein
MTASALRTANSSEARKWIEEVFTAARILARSEVLEAARSDVLAVLFSAAEDARIARSNAPCCHSRLPSPQLADAGARRRRTNESTRSRRPPRDSRPSSELFPQFEVSVTACRFTQHFLPYQDQASSHEERL